LPKYQKQSMSTKRKIHFEISERKIILRFFDVFFVLLGLYFIGAIFNQEYLTVAASTPFWTIVLVIYLVFFATIFEMYNLQVASNQFLVLKNTILTVSTTVFVYLFTPFFSPELPSNRLQILLFF
jgi:hypothetical protein